MRALILILLIISLVSCKETYCPAFPTHLIDYYPYSKGDVLLFKNSNNDTLTLIVINDWASDNYSFDWNCKCSCGAEAGFDTDMSSDFSLRISGNINIAENNIEFISNFYDSITNNDIFSYYQEGINPFSKEQISTLSDTILIEKQPFHRIGKVKIVKGKGIVEFWDNEQNCNWIKIE
jgi:hypothetical protein